MGFEMMPELEKEPRGRSGSQAVGLLKFQARYGEFGNGGAKGGPGKKGQIIGARGAGAMSDPSWQPGARPMFIGICGGSGSGKTVVSHQLAVALGHGQASCLSFDDYYREPSQIPPEVTGNYDHPLSLDGDLFEAHLEQLRAGRPIVPPRYDFAERVRKEAPPVQPRPFVIVEGILLFANPAIRNALDLAVFLDVPSDVRLARRLKRDVEERGRSLESVLSQYFATVRPMYDRFVAPTQTGADLVLPHGLEMTHVVREIFSALEIKRTLLGS